MKRMIALLLCLLLCVGMFTGCESVSKLWLQDASGIRDLPYTLNQTMIDDFYAALEQAEQLSIAGEDMDAIDAAVTRLDDAYMALIDQNQIAYIRYCLDQTSTRESDRYLYAADVIAEVETAYNAMLKRVYQSETPVRDELFADWSEAEIDRMLRYDEQIAELETRNAEILLEYRELEEQTEAMLPLYNEFVTNNNTIARIYGYENYYDYAYAIVYQRDYGQQELTQMRQYISQYLLPAYEQVNAEFDVLYAQLDAQEQTLLYELLYDSYDSGEINYVKSYFLDLPASARQGMGQMLEQNRAVFTAYRHAYQGAFTTWIGGEPFCYFGTGYSSAQTLIHELGHYYGSQYVEPWSQPMDLSETQSQGNEWLFTAWLRKQLSPTLYEVYSTYKMITDLASVIGYTLIDSFEQQVYSHENAGSLSMEEYETMMAETAQAYGGIEYIQAELFDIQSYWKQIVIESPVYYISYAVSAVAAMDLFLTAREDEALARQQYIALIEEPVENGGFLANIRQAEIAGPFEETVYEKLYAYCVN